MEKGAHSTHAILHHALSDGWLSCGAILFIPNYALHPTGALLHHTKMSLYCLWIPIDCPHLKLLETLRCFSGLLELYSLPNVENWVSELYTCGRTRYIPWVTCLQGPFPLPSGHVSICQLRKEKGWKFKKVKTFQTVTELEREQVSADVEVNWP